MDFDFKVSLLIHNVIIVISYEYLGIILVSRL